MTNVRKLTLCLIVALCASTAWAQQAALDFKPLEEVALAELKQTGTPGAAIAIVSGDRVMFAKGFGTADVDTGAPVTPDMLFRLGSTTKMFTAAALVALAEKGAINLDDPIGKVVPGLHPQIARLTAHQLLSHTSGLFDEAPMFGSHDEDALGKEVRSWAGDRFFTEPGAIYSYANPGYWTAGFLIEALSGKKYADQMADSLFKPLGMSKTTLRPLVAMTYPIAQGHDDNGGKPTVVRPAANNAASWPAGSIFSNVHDLSRFVIAFMNDGRIDGKEVLSPAVIAKLQQGHAAIPGSDARYGYGLNVGTSQGLRVVQHGGSRSGYGSTIRMVPDRKFGVVIVANRTGASLGRTASKAMEIVLGVAPADTSSRTTHTLTDADMTRYAGVYSQGPRTMEILKKDGKLYLRQGARESALEKVGERELASGATRLVMVAGAADTIEYLHSGGRSWRKLAAARDTSQTPPQTDARFEALAALVQEKMREHRVPGVALGIIDNGAVTIRGFGLTSADDTLPITDHTVFPIASISKTFAATAMMRLVEQGKVDLKAPVRTYLPDFRVQDETASRDVTIWHLLTHTPGWEGQVSGPERGEDTLRNFVTTQTNLMQLAPPGVAWSYNNAGFSIAGRVIESITGTSINRAIRDLVFTPLGLEHAGTTAGDFITQRFALGHGGRGPSTALGAGGNPPSVQRPFVPSTSVTAGGVGVCMTDLMSYARFHMGDGTSAKGERVLTRASLEQMRTPQLRKHSMDDDMGIGWHLRTVGPLRVAAHGGTLGGHILLLEIAPERNFAIGILTNANTGWRLIQDVERAALKAYASASFSMNQAISHRGLVETLPLVEPLAKQPDHASYVGKYLRPMNAVVVRSEGGTLIVQVQPNNGQPQTPIPIAFYGPDRAVVTDGQDRGQSLEFIRSPDGQVKWVRVTGRIAVRTP